MVITGTATGLFSSIKYFDDKATAGACSMSCLLTASTAASGFNVGVLWLLINWGLDFAILLPLSGKTPIQYFAEIGTGYLCMVMTPAAIGHVIQVTASSRAKTT
jgi:hypothetical protein